MIADYHTNTVYVSGRTLKEFPREIEKIKAIIEVNGYSFRILNRTDDYYCRDYMPVQVDKDKFVQFVFYPTEYHQHSDYQYISNPIQVWLESGFDKFFCKPQFSKIILDGGNVVRGRKKVIITDKVISDNKFRSHR